MPVNTNEPDVLPLTCLPVRPPSPTPPAHTLLTTPLRISLRFTVYMGNSPTTGEEAFTGILSSKDAGVPPTEAQLATVWDAYDKNKDGILVCVCGCVAH